MYRSNLGFQQPPQHQGMNKPYQYNWNGSMSFAKLVFAWTQEGKAEHYTQFPVSKYFTYFEVLWYVTLEFNRAFFIYPRRQACVCVKEYLCCDFWPILLGRKWRYVGKKMLTGASHFQTFRGRKEAVFEGKLCGKHTSLHPFWQLWVGLWPVFFIIKRAS